MDQAKTDNVSTVPWKFDVFQTFQNQFLGNSGHVNGWWLRDQSTPANDTFQMAGNPQRMRKTPDVNDLESRLKYSPGRAKTKKTFFNAYYARSKARPGSAVRICYRRFL